MWSKKPRIYGDTSVIGGCLDDEFRKSSRRLFAGFRAGAAILVVSDTPFLEIRSPREVLQDENEDV